MPAPIFWALSGFAILLGCTLLPGFQAQAEPTIRAGQLVCEGGVGIGLLVISSKPFNCRFTPANGGPPHRYRARITNLGVDVGITGPTIMVWNVLASTRSAARKRIWAYLNAWWPPL